MKTSLSIRIFLAFNPPRVKFNTGQPHRTDSFITVAFSACSTPLYKDEGAFDPLLRICVAFLLK